MCITNFHLNILYFVIFVVKQYITFFNNKENIFYCNFLIIEATKNFFIYFFSTG